MHRSEFGDQNKRVNREVVVNYIDHRGACCLRQISLAGLATLILNNVNAPRKNDHDKKEDFRQ